MRNSEHHDQTVGCILGRQRLEQTSTEYTTYQVEKVTAATGPGKGATDQTAGGISLVNSTSSQENSPGLESTSHNLTESPNPRAHSAAPNLPDPTFEQTAPSSGRSTRQQSRDGHIPRNEMCRTCEDDESKTTGQTANEEAADTSNPNATSVGPTEPAGTSYGPQDKSNEIDEGVEGQGEKDERGENYDGGTRTSPTATSYPIQPHLRVNHHPQHAAVPDGVSLVNPTSSQGSLPRARVNTPRPHPTSESPNPPPSTPNPPFEQTASTSRRPTDQRSRNGHLPSNETRHTREHDEGSQRRGQSRSRGRREADNDDGKDNDDHQAHVVPQNPQSTRQTAYNEATDTSNLNATSARLTEPVGTLNGPLNESNENEGKGTKGEKGENDDSGDENVRHAYVVPSPTPPASRPPPSTPLEGEKEKGQQLSGRTDEAATHQIEPPRQKSRTTPPKRMPDDGRSSREGQGVAIGHRQAVGEEDEVGGKVDDQKTSY
ncbi:hypothetical protein PAXINDRAFT_21381 [Paxillus involutus ATCC 200175]|uniref:Uncharacterized protein n=1 Tax=Paxillus involutus ATCC 200175 TaxID=664439 RepID=A0A0C9STD0_PAXIN|nr:hypothetical protein PAXINDRAFT_21381 [Paxillus involutus ATCC 200175]